MATTEKKGRKKSWSPEEKAGRIKIRERWYALCTAHSEDVESFDHTRNDLRCYRLDPSMMKGMRIVKLNADKPRYRLFFGSDTEKIGWRYCYCCNVSPLHYRCCQPSFD